jgi:hypothetical protein
MIRETTGACCRDAADRVVRTANRGVLCATTAHRTRETEMRNRSFRIFGFVSSLMIVATLLGFAAIASAAGNDEPWKIRIPAQTEIGKTPVAGTQFEFACTAGKGGMISLSVILPTPEELRAFPLEEFEGPDGIGETHDLAEWSVTGGKKPARARTSISGWRGVDGDGFILSRARDSAASSDIARIAKRLMSSDQTRLRLVVKPVKKGEALKVEAPIAGHREAIEKILAPCLAPVK